MEVAISFFNNGEKIQYQDTLQIYSLFEYVKRLGCQVQIIDYNLYNQNKKSSLYNFLDDNTILTSVRYNDINEIREYPPLADRYIFVNGDFSQLNICALDKDKCIAYGIKDINKDEIEKIEQKYEKVSTLFDIKDKNVTRCLDPMFLLDKNQWDEFSQKSNLKLDKNYILVYCDNVTKDILEYSRKVARDQKLYILADKMQFTLFNGKRLKNIMPYDLVNLIKNSQDVITNCDDAIKLSIIFDKNIHIILDEENDDNYKIEMINEYGLIDRVVNLNSDKLEDITDYTKADEKINSLKNITFDFIKEST